LCAIATYVWDFERAKLLQVGEWYKPGAGTVEIANAVKALEAESFRDLRYWNGSGWGQNPRGRWSDTDLRLISDLHKDHGLKFGAAEKKDSDAALHALRAALQMERIEIHPRCERSIETLKNLAWDKNRVDFARSNRIGHGDLADVMKYAWRMVDKQANPLPPHGILMAEQHKYPNDVLFLTPDHMRTKKSVRETLESVLPGMRRFRKQ
jgi:hypothetical protein